MLRILLIISSLAAASVALTCPREMALEDPAVVLTLSGVENAGYECRPPKFPTIPQMPHTFQRVFEAICEKDIGHAVSYVTIRADHQIHSTLLCQISVKVHEVTDPRGRR